MENLKQDSFCAETSRLNIAQYISPYPMKMIGVFADKAPEQMLAETIERVRRKYSDYGESQVQQSARGGCNLYFSFQKYEVFADCISSFIAQYGKPRRYSERGEEYMSAVLKSHQESLQEYGYTIITRHDSITGKTVSYYGRNKDDCIPMAER